MSGDVVKIEESSFCLDKAEVQSGECASKMPLLTSTCFLFWAKLKGDMGKLSSGKLPSGLISRVDAGHPRDGVGVQGVHANKTKVSGPQTGNAYGQTQKGPGGRLRGSRKETQERTPKNYRAHNAKGEPLGIPPAPGFGKDCFHER